MNLFFKVRLSREASGLLAAVLHRTDVSEFPCFRVPMCIWQPADQYAYSFELLVAIPMPCLEDLIAFDVSDELQSQLH